MKKALILSLISVFICSSVFAATSYTDTELPESGEHPSVNVKYTIDNTTGSYSIGFAKDSNRTALDSADINLAIDKDDNTIISNVPESGEDTGLYVYWDITSAAQYKLALKAAGPLTYATDNKINFTVSGSTVDSVEDETFVNFTTIDGEASSEIIPLTTAGTLSTKEGVQMLTIKSVPGELENKPAGDYSAALTLELTAN